MTWAAGDEEVLRWLRQLFDRLELVSVNEIRQERIEERDFAKFYSWESPLYGEWIGLSDTYDLTISMTVRGRRKAIEARTEKDVTPPRRSRQLRGPKGDG